MSRFKLLRRLMGYISVSQVKKIQIFLSHYFGGLYHRIDNHHMFLFGGGLAFSLFVCIIPFILIVFSILGNLLDTAQVEEQIQFLIETTIPYAEYATYAKKIILSRIPEVIEYKNTAAWLGGVGLLFAASGLFSSMRTVLNTIFGVTEDKHLIIGKLRDFAMILLLIIFLFMSILVLPVVNVLNDIARNVEFLKFLQVSTLLDTLFSVASLFIMFFLFFLFYYLIPYEKLGKRVPLVAAFWATFFWELARQLFGYYIFNIASWNRIYGTYALIVVVAFWIYYASILFILGAEIGQLYRERKVAREEAKRLKDENPLPD